MRWVWLGVGPLLVFTGCVQILGGDNDYRAGEGGGAGSAGMGGSGGGSASGSASGSGGGGGTGGGSSSASGSGGAGGGLATCPTGSTWMVLGQGPQGPYCIDATEVRGTGVATAVLAWLIDWLRAHGYERCGVDFESFNYTARRFWLKHFTGYTMGLVRRIDERIVEA